MKFSQLLAALLIIFCVPAYAQSRISGTVITEENEPLPFAHILLFQVSDSTFLKGGVANESGRFEVYHKIPKAFFVKIESLGYADHYSGEKEPSSVVDIGSIILKADSEVLDDVVISGKKPLFEQRVDRTIVNVQSSVTNIGSSVLHVLSKSPSVMVNRSTNQIRLMGKDGVLVMIDNKLVRMEAADLISFLESLPADNIETIELITAPPARYDAQGNAGIININTLQNTANEGLSGQFSTNFAYGRTPKLGGTFNASLQKNKIYTYANLSSNYNYSREIVSLFTDVSYPDEHLISDLTVLRNSRVGLHSGEIGINYSLSDQTVIGLMFSAHNRDWKLDAEVETDQKNSTHDRVLHETISYEENKLFRSLSNINFNHRISEEMQINADYDYIRFSRKNPTKYTVSSKDSHGVTMEEQFLSDSETPLSIHVFKTDFQQKISEGIAYETGLKATLSDFTNDVRVAVWENGTYVDDPEFTDLFKMGEQIYAAYFSADWQVSPALKAVGGVRYEYYDLTLTSDVRGSIIDRSKGKFFPSFYMNYKKDDNHELNLSYVRRVQRPGFMTLAPYFYFFDRNTLFTGNPNVIPTISDQLQLDFRYKAVTTTFQLTDFQFPILNWQPEIEENLHLFMIRPQQSEESQMFSITAAIPWEINKWWSSRYNVVARHLRQSPVVEENVYRQNSNNFEFNITQSFKLGGQMELEGVVIYYSPIIEGVARIAANPSLNLGIKRKMGPESTLTFNVNDVFNSGSRWPIEANLRQEGIYYDWIFDAEGPVFRLNFSMTFGNRPVAKSRDRKTGSTEEQQRLD